MLVKSIGYRNQGFFDTYDGEHDYASYTRSEDALVVGFQLLHGHRWNVGRVKTEWDVFYGIGLRDRHRHYTLYTSSRHSSGSLHAKADPPVGTFTVDELLPSIHFGVNFGVNVLK